MKLPIYKMPWPVWDKISEIVPYDEDGCIDNSNIENYLEKEYGLVSTGQHFIPPDDDWDDADELYFYYISDSMKFTMFALRWV